MFKAGHSRICISPPVGSSLAGFAAREGVSQGIHDDLFVRALVLEKEGHTIVLVSVEVLALSSKFVEHVRGVIHQRTGIPPSSIMIASTHTHAGPVTITTFFNPQESVDATYMDHLAEALVECVASAWRERFPARAGVGVAYVQGVGVNRRSHDQRPVDEEVGIIKIEDRDRRTRAVFMNYACHPTVLGSDNLLVTGDFPAFAIQKIESTLGPDSFAMFVNGAQGNISMGHSSELSAIGIITPGRTFEHAAELGHSLARATLEVIPTIATNPCPTLDAVCVPLDLPLKKFPSVHEAADALHSAEKRLANLGHANPPTEEFLRAKTERLYAMITHFYAIDVSSSTNGFLRIELQGVRVNEAVLLAVPAEVFVEVGLQLKKRAPQRTFIVGLANGYLGYLPNRAAHAVGGYEVVSAKCAPEAEDRLIEKAIELERKLFTEETRG